MREPVSGITHAIACALSIAGLVLLVSVAVATGSRTHIVTFAVFGSTLVLLYLTSSLYHLLPLSARGTRHLRRLDHILIFLLIAGTYTPVCVIALGGWWGWSLLAAAWLLAASGVILKIVWLDAPRWLSTICYGVLGWIVIIAVWPLAISLQIGFAWLIAGGVFYTAGAVMYGLKLPNPVPGVFGFHEIFHLMCIAGSLCHFWLIYRYVAFL